MSSSSSSQTLVVAKHCPKELQPDHSGWSLNNFVLVKKLGVGGASAVYQAIHRRSRACVALKLYFKSKLTALNTHQVQREYGAFEDKEHVALIIEFAAKGDLFDLLRQMGGRMKEADVVTRVMAPFMLGLAYLHNLGIIHRDIKLENTLFSSDGTLKIADFGLSVDANVESPVTRLGTLDYMSPEVMVCPDKRHPSENKDSTILKYGAKVDAWACGVLAYELLVGCPPFGMSTREASVRAVLYQAPKTPLWLPAAASDFIRWALTKKAGPRPSVAQLLQHSWILSHMHPAGRASIKQAIQMQPRASSSAQNPMQPMSCGLQSNDGTSHGLTTMSLNSVNSTSSAVQAALADPLSVGALQLRPDSTSRTHATYTPPSSMHSQSAAQPFASAPSSTQSTLAKHNSVTTGAQALLHAAHALPELPPVQTYESVHASMDLAHKAQHAMAAASRSGPHSSSAAGPPLAAPLQINSSSTLGTDLVSSRSQEVWGSLSGLNPPGSGASSAIARSPPDSMGPAGAQRPNWSMWQPPAAAYIAAGHPMGAPNSHQSSSFSPPTPLDRIAGPGVPALMSEPPSQQNSDVSGGVNGATLASAPGTGLRHSVSPDAAAANATAAWVASAMQDLSGNCSMEPMPTAPQSGASTGGSSTPLDNSTADAQLAALVAQLQQQCGDNFTLGILETALGRPLSPTEATCLQHVAQQACQVGRKDDSRAAAPPATAGAQPHNSVFVHPEDMRRSCWGNMQSMLASHGTITSGAEHTLDSNSAHVSLRTVEGHTSTPGACAPGSCRHSVSPDNTRQLLVSLSAGAGWDTRPTSVNSGCVVQSGAVPVGPSQRSLHSGSPNPMRDTVMHDIGEDSTSDVHMRSAGNAAMMCDDVSLDTAHVRQQGQRTPGRVSGPLEPVAEGLLEESQAFLMGSQRWGLAQLDVMGGRAGSVSNHKPR